MLIPLPKKMYNMRTWTKIYYHPFSLIIVKIELLFTIYIETTLQKQQ